MNEEMEIGFLRGLEDDYNNISAKNSNNIYVTTDTKKIFLGDKELCEDITDFGEITIN